MKAPARDRHGLHVVEMRAEVIPLRPPYDASRRGYHIEYRGDGTDRCPGCGRQHFHIGRMSAECAFCQTAMSISGSTSSGGIFTSTKSRTL